MYSYRTGIFIGKGCMKIENLPSGKILDTQSLGEIVRQHRKSQGVTQVEFAALCSVGVRFISDLENGKSTVEMAKVLLVLNSLGLELMIQQRGWTHSEAVTKALGQGL